MTRLLMPAFGTLVVLDTVVTDSPKNLFRFDSCGPYDLYRYVAVGLVVSL